MMTFQLYQHLDRDNHSMMLGTRLACCKILLAMVVLLAWGAGRCTAQNVIYSNSYPVTTTYPNSYPTSYPAYNSASAFGPAPIVDYGSVDSIHSRPGLRSDNFTRVASTNSFNSRTRSPIDGSLDARRPADPVSPYDLTMIQSARQSAAQFRRIAESASPITDKIAQ